MTADTKKRQRGVAAEKASAQSEAARHKGQEQALKTEIASLQGRLEAARQDVDRAQGEVDWLRDQPLIPEPPSLDELMKVQMMFPDKTVAPKSPCQPFTLASQR